MNLGSTNGAQAADQMQQSAVQASAPSANQPDDAQPDSSGSAASILGGPSPSQPPSPSPQQQPAPQMTPQQAQFTHDTAFGRAAKFLLGTPQSYSVDATGQTVATNDPQPPGQLFRSILAGALLGGAVGSQSKTGSGLASAAQGGAAVLNAQKQEDTAKRANAQRDFENGQQVDKINQEKIFQQAQIAAMHVSNVNAQRGLDLSSQEHIDNLNKYNTGLQSAIDDAPGSQHPPVLADGSDINGKMGNGGELMAAYTKDPRVMDPPQGFHRTVTSKVDYSGLNFDGEKGWVDKDGQPVDIATRTTNTISDIPESIFKKQVTITGAQANSYVGATVYKPGEKLNTSLGDLAALTKQATDRSVEQEKVQIEDRRAKSQGSGGKGASAGAPPSEADDAIIKGMIAKPPTVDLYSMTGLRNGRREELLEKAQQADPNFDQIKYKNAIKLLSSATSGDDAKSIQTFNTFLGHAYDLSKSVDDLGNTKRPFVNVPLNKLRDKAQGNPQVSAIVGRIDAARTEFQNFLNNNHALSETDKREGEKLLNEDMSPLQMQGQMKQFTHTALIRLGSVNEKIRNGTGANLPTILSSQGREAVRHFGLSDTASSLLQDELPAQAAQQLKEGQTTHFHNGQEWTLYKGQQVRLK